MITVIRVIKYQYDTVERMVEDQKRWTTSHSSREMSMESRHFNLDIEPEETLTP